LIRLFTNLENLSGRASFSALIVVAAQSMSEFLTAMAERPQTKAKA
jgi:hypothetical protein